MSFLYSFGSAMVGVFFPFLVSHAFGFEVWQLMIWLIFFNLAGFCVVYPLNRFLAKRFSTKGTLQIGLFFLALFYLTLSVSRGSSVLITFATIFFILGIYLFWPNYHLFNLHSTKDGNRGNFMGSMQAILVSANVLAPVMSGILLQKGLDHWIFLITAVAFGSAIYFSHKLKTSPYQLSNWADINLFFTQKIRSKKIFRISIIEGIQAGILFAVWPIFFKSVLTGFTQMGFLVAFTAIVEIISAKISGRITDKKSAKKTLKYAAIARFFDLGIRSLLFFIPTAMMAGIASFFAGFLGPVFNISYYTRIVEIAEENPENEFDFFIAREWILCVCRGLVFIAAAVLSYYFDVTSFAILIFIGALASFGLRKT